ncbi:MAG: FtsW/RodA/SpoVE family cell cycle protein [Actinomycetota bacterium]|nr:FtsW/RodA/SpoVE family cell cycle protein [Actinomycetota bacterium]
MSARTRELFALVPVSLLVAAGFAAILITRQGAAEGTEINEATAIYGGAFLGACVFGHIFIRARLPDADPYLFPLVALLATFGLVEIYRISPSRAGQQAVWFGVGLALFCLTIVLLRDHRVLERYRYLIALTGIGLLMLPRVPGIGQVTNGAYLSVGAGPVQFQPAEFSKLAVIVFLASYLSETRDVLVRGRLPRLSMKHLGPLLVIWGLAMLMLIVIRDLGSSLMFFGGFLALVYVATSRLSLVLGGMAMFLAGAWFLSNRISHVQDRIDVWRDPFQPELVEREGYQISQSLYAMADGGLFGEGLGQSLIQQSDGTPILPAAHTDLIYSVIASELGLFGATGVLLVALLIVARGFKTAVLATDGFSKLLAAGLAAVFALQVFVIVGGVVKAIPLTGVTLPFVSYGGSSIVANFVLVALLLIVSDKARRDPAAQRGGLV